ncbi:MAG: hypothetical protein U5J98_09365 [Halobacteriales archaeon]|nr:hypothetical protein [Halobacteriales archaeon]
MTWWHSRASVGRTVTPTFLIGVGLLAAATALIEILTENQLLGATPAGGYLEFLMLAVPAVGLVYAGYWLETGEVDGEAIWRIGAFAVGGAVVASSLTLALLWATATAADIDPLARFVLFVGTGTEGSLLGVLAGTFAVTDSRYRGERTVADELETLQALVRHDARNRLTIIGGHLTKLTESADLPAESVEIIETQLGAIESMLADTGTAAALRSGQPTSAVDLVDVVTRQVSVLRDTYEDVEVRTELPASAASRRRAARVGARQPAPERGQPPRRVDARDRGLGGDEPRTSCCGSPTMGPASRRPSASTSSNRASARAPGWALPGTDGDRALRRLGIDRRERARGTAITLTLPRADDRFYAA